MPQHFDKVGPSPLARLSLSRQASLRRSLRLANSGAAGFDMVDLKQGAGRGLLATLNRGTVKLIGKNNTQSAPALAMAA